MKRTEQRSNMIEKRNVDAEFRISDVDGKPTIFGYAAKFNARSSDLGGWYEQIDPKAFDRSLKTKPEVKGLFNHDSNFVLGSTKAKTMTVDTDDRGLQYEIDPPDTQWAKDLITSMKRGDINQSSFGFICRNASWSEDPETGCDLRTVLDADLIDVSVVSFPAYPQATSGVRSFPADMPTEVRTRLESRRLSHTKEVDGEHLTPDDFLIVGDPDKTDTWHLPWRFSDEEKTKSHLRDALARFDQVEGVSDDVKKAAWDKLVKLSKEHGIDVSADDKGDADRSLRIRVMLASLNEF